MKKETTGLFITRAQPGLHIGQVDGIIQGVAHGLSKVIIGIGSADKEGTCENPFTYTERKHMIELSAKELLQDIEVEVMSIPDFGDNEKWRNHILKYAPPFKYILTGNENVKEVFKNTDIKIIPLEIRKFVKSSTIRGQLATYNIQELEKVLSHDVVQYLQEINAPEKLRNIFNKERKTPSLVVDMVLIDEEGKIILIDRKNFPTGAALPGGFNDYGERSRDAAIREVKEETGLIVEVESELGTRDEPNRDPRAHNVSRAFKGKIIGGKLNAADDAKAIIKIDVADLGNIDFAFPDHKEMILKALKKTTQ